MATYPARYFIRAASALLLFYAFVGAVPVRTDYSIAAIRYGTIATFSEADQSANLRNQARMIELAGSVDRVVPGHDPRQFERCPTRGRIARIRGPEPVQMIPTRGRTANAQ